MPSGTKGEPIPIRCSTVVSIMIQMSSVFSSSSRNIIEHESGDIPKAVEYGKIASMDDLWSAPQIPWREEMFESDEDLQLMSARAWKPNVETHNARVNDKATAPDVQTVHFLNYDYSNYFQMGINNSDSRYHGRGDRYRLKKTSLLPQEGVASMPILLGDGTMAYISRDTSVTYTPNSMPSTMNSDGIKPGFLLGRSISELMRHVDNLERRALKRRLQSLEDDDSSKVHEPMDDTNTTAGYESNVIQRDVRLMEQKHTETHSIASPSRLWVDKYAPTQFSDLLSDEKTNRDVLRSLHEWDPFVFHKNPPARPIQAVFKKDIKGNRRETQSGEKIESNKRKSPDDDYDDANTEAFSSAKPRDVRPILEKRVILLSGPPGVGKTTMAHIIAKHAGYRPVEINASDERTASVLKERVLRAMESSTLTLTTQNMTEIQPKIANRPNCLILDEIDGADANTSISTLMDIIREDLPAKNSRNQKPYLRRPIIFICNNKYAPALRPLLPYAQQFEVFPPLSERLNSRLRAILSAESISVNGGSSLLNQLIHSTGGDIRSCLFSLQFVSSRAKALHQTRNLGSDDHSKKLHSNGPVDISHALAATLDGTRGLKDDRSDIVATLNVIFRKQVVRGDHQKMDKSKDIHRVLNIVDSFGDTSKILDSLFTNLVEIPFVDPMFDRSWSALDWLSYSDILRSFKTQLALTNTIEHHNVQKNHIPTAACAIHYLCRIEKRPNLNFSSRSILDAVYKTETNLGLLGKFIDGLTPRLRALFIGSVPVIDLIPYFLWLLSAGQGNSCLNRPVSNVDMLMKNEKLAFQRHVDLLRSLGLTYAKDDHNDKLRASSDISHYRLTPDISELLKFKGVSHEHSCKRNEIPSSMKQLLAHSVHIEDVRQRSEVNSLLATDASSKRPRQTDHTSTTTDDEDMLPAVNDSMNDAENCRYFLGAFAAKSKAAKNAKKVALLGIGKTSSKASLSNTGSGIPLENVVKFKYQKGFTQAVRMPCSARDFSCHRRRINGQYEAIGTIRESYGSSTYPSDGV